MSVALTRFPDKHVEEVKQKMKEEMKKLDECYGARNVGLARIRTAVVMASQRSWE